MPRLLSLWIVTCSVTVLGCADRVPLETGDACETIETWYADADGDGVGTTDQIYMGCDPPDGYVAAAGDCDDNDASTTACDTGSAGDTGKVVAVVSGA
jgi:hypothetical protein